MRPTSQKERKEQLEEMKLEHIRNERRYFLKRVSDGKILTWNPFLVRRKAEFVEIPKPLAYEILDKERAEQEARMKEELVLDEVALENFVEKSPTEDDDEQSDDENDGREDESETVNATPDKLKKVAEIDSKKDSNLAFPVPALEKTPPKQSGQLNKMNRRQLIKYIYDKGGDGIGIKSMRRDGLLEMAKGL